MNLKELKREVCQANLDLVAAGLVMQTWGNVSGIDRDAGQVVIKPSGVSYEGMSWDQMVAVSLASGEVVDGKLRPSSDTPTHLELYRAWPTIGGVVHTHSLFATSWAQARREIPVYGTTHADFCDGPVPLTRPLSPQEVQDDYEANTGRVMLERMSELDPSHVPGVLVVEHGPFAWGASPAQAVTAAVTLEQVARMALHTVTLQPYPKEIQPSVRQKHFSRKHGPDAYYGQDG
jgi:L-ribulose-5-phosphate 4-epimerase